MSYWMKQTGVAAVAAAMLVMAGCGGGGGETPNVSGNPQATPPKVSALTVTRYASPASDKPDTVVSNPAGDRLEFWSGQDNQGVIVPRQARMTLKAGGSLRVYYSAAGIPQRIVDEISGDFVTQTFDNDTLFVRAYRADGAFVGGYKVTQAGDRTAVSPLLGQAYFSGQLALDLNGGSRPASAVLVPEAEVLAGTATELPAVYQTFLKGGASAAPSGRVRALAAGGQQVASGIAQGATGALLAVAGYYAPAIAAAALGTATAAVAGPILAGGLVLAAGWNMANGVEDIIGGGIKLVSDTGNRFADGASPWDSLTQQATLISGGGNLATTARSLAQVVGSAGDVLSSLVSAAGLTAPGQLPVIATTPVSGSAVDSSGTSVALAGTVDGNGAFSAQGSGGSNALMLNGLIANSGQASGSFAGYLGSGSATGSTAPLGQCQQTTNSGGRGTFVKAHNLSVTQGLSVFSYDAYSIPDQFTVSTNGQTAFGTPGLVSGQGSAGVQLSGSSIVFVAVNAPNSGTQWEYQLSCPQ